MRSGCIEGESPAVPRPDPEQAEAVVADVSMHPFAPNSFDLVLSRFGVMFFGDPIAAFTNVRRAMKPEGRLSLAVFRSQRRPPPSGTEKSEPGFLGIT